MVIAHVVKILHSEDTVMDKQFLEVFTVISVIIVVIATCVTAVINIMSYNIDLKRQDRINSIIEILKEYNTNSQINT